MSWSLVVLALGVIWAFVAILAIGVWNSKDGGVQHGQSQAKDG